MKKNKNEFIPNKDKKEESLNEDEDTKTINELYNKLETLLNKKKIQNKSDKTVTLDKFTNVTNNSKIKTKGKSSISSYIPQTQRNKSHTPIKKIIISQNSKQAKNINEFVNSPKKDINNSHLISNLLTRMKNYEDEKIKKINDSKLKKHYEIIRSCTGTPRINSKSKKISEDFFGRMNKFQELKNTKSKLLKEKLEEKLLCEVKVDYKKLEIVKIDERVKTLFKWDNDRKDKIIQKIKFEEQKNLEDCTFQPRTNRDRTAMKFINNSYVLDKNKKDRSFDKNDLNETSYTKYKINNSRINSTHSEDTVNNSTLRKINYKNVNLAKVTKKDEVIIEQLLLDRFKFLKLKFKNS